MRTITSALPALVGSGIGVWLFVHPSYWARATLVFVALLAGLGMLVARLRFKANPIVFGWLIEFWIVVPPILTGLGVAFSLWLTLGVDPVTVLGPGLDAKVQEDLMKFVAGALSTFGGVLMMRGGDDATGWFWPATQFRLAAATACDTGSTGQEDLYFAAHQPHTYDNKTQGWGFAARRARATVIASKLL